MSNIIIYKTKDKKTQIDVKFEDETVWLTQEQMANLFGQTKQNISLHINNCFKEKELSKKSTVKESLTVRTEGSRRVKRSLVFYNLDVIISVGYRVKSVRGTQFRQWATQRLKDYLVEGIVINEKRLDQRNKEIKILHDGIRILSRAIEKKVANSDDFPWLHQFRTGLQLLDDYDNESLDLSGRHHKVARYPSTTEYLELVNTMRSEFSSGIFGKQKDNSFESAINQIKQGFGKNDAYPTIEEKAAMLLYLIVKNHAFVDGNKRIAAACFLLFLKENGILYSAENQPVISNEALASLTLFIASSKADEMETVKKLLISVLNRNLK
ncbi:MAG: type II toxin-antitoxin system death-on-curing family toxin [Bacteroidetes bacterium]|nr:type II toxin-antitoxin system death-on-curing family toxin [Bacteroidota bacterium]